jgi:hypothetical protein
MHQPPLQDAAVTPDSFFHILGLALVRTITAAIQTSILNLLPYFPFISLSVRGSAGCRSLTIPFDFIQAEKAHMDEMASIGWEIDDLRALHFRASEDRKG